MSIVVNGAEKIAAHFNTTVPQVLDVYMQHHMMTDQLMFDVGVAWSIVTIVISCIVGYWCYKDSYSHDAGDFMAGALMALMGVGLLGGIMVLALAGAYVDALPIGVQYHMYYDWIAGVVGV